MPLALESYLPLNPFVDLSVGEAEMWGTRSWLDVPEIHSAPFAEIRQAIMLVKSNGRTQVRFVRGMGGSGKSHLFARIRRELAETVFYAYASNPPLRADSLEGFLLGKIVSSLRHKARYKDGSEAPFTQLRLLAYALLKPVIEQSLSFEEMHEAWLAVPVEERKDILHGAMLMLESEYPMVPRGVLRTLLNVLRDDKENLAAQWLAGTTYLTDADLRFLGEPEPLGRELHGVVIHLLGKLAAHSQRPFVLVLDQLDLVTSTEMLSEFQRLLFALIDQSSNWCVLIGLIGDRFRFWEDGLSQAMKGRVGIPNLEHPEEYHLQVIDVSPIVASDKAILIERRLASPSLPRQRELDGVESSIFPLRDEDMKSLVSGGAVFARHLLAACSEKYATSVMSSSRDTRTPLSEKMDAILEEAMDQSRVDTPYLSAVEMGERIRELVELLAEQPVHVTPGELRELNGEYEGTDHCYETGGKHARIVVCDLTRRPFMAVLERLQDEDGHTILIRGASTGALGQVTQDLFQRFQLDNHFHQLSASDMATLAGLGMVLAAVREGNYGQLVTEPPPTGANITDVLRNSGRLRSMKMWATVQQAFVGRPKAARNETPSRPLAATNGNHNGYHPLTLGLDSLTGSSPLSVPTSALPGLNGFEPLSSVAAEALKVILESERWMEINRLHRRLQEVGCDCTLESLRYALRTSELASHVMMHPVDPILTGGGPQIVLWHDSMD